jgi:hypothetical protein
MKKSKIVTKSDEKKSELDYDAIENEALEYFVWYWINKLPILHADIKRNKNLENLFFQLKLKKFLNLNLFLNYLIKFKTLKF